MANTCISPCFQGQHLFCFLYLYFFFSYIKLKPCSRTLPILPSSNKPSMVYLLQPLDGNSPNSHFCFCKHSKEPLHINVETRLLLVNMSWKRVAQERSDVSCCPQTCPQSGGLMAALASRSHHSRASSSDE